VLHREPYELLTADDGTQALALVERHRPEVVVSDYQMPGMLGTELLARVKELLPDSARFLITGAPSLEMALAAINQGAVTRIFIKPFPSLHLAMAIRGAMERVELARLAGRLLERVRTGAMPADDYQPHDVDEILRQLRRAVGRR
jgi:DNA-binding NtrC family response regulator